MRNSWFIFAAAIRNNRLVRMVQMGCRDDLIQRGYGLQKFFSGADKKRVNKKIKNSPRKIWKIK